jgi:peptidoglycan/LPS O-acetylase OafA/YrhL
MTLLERFKAVSFTGPGFHQIRLAAAMVVVAHHSWWGVEDSLFSYSGGFVQFGLLAVIVFFCISGFLVTPGLVRYQNVMTFGVHRIVRIFPALFVVVFASMFLLGPVETTFSISAYFSDPQLYFYAKNAVTLMSHFLPGVTMDGHPVLINGALWTLNIELWSYISLAILSILGALRHRSFFLAILVICYALYVASTLDSAVGAILPPRFTTFISLFVYFMGGAALFIFSDLIPLSATLAVGALVLALIGLPLGWGAIVLPVCVPYITVYLGLTALPGHAFFKRDLSYGVYLIHAPVIVVILFLLPDLHLGWRLLLIAISITLILAYLSWTFVESPALGRKKLISEWMNQKFALLSQMTRSQILRTGLRAQDMRIADRSTPQGPDRLGPHGQKVGPGPTT